LAASGPEGTVRHYRLPGAIDLFVYPTRRFKTAILSVVFQRPLDEGSAAAALVPYLLRRGTRHHPDMVSVERRLESLFGAGLDVDVFRIGERQALCFRLDVVDDRYLFMGGRDLFRQGAALLREILTEPALCGDGFPPDVLEQERTNMRRFVAGLRSDKGRYALDRCIRSMCRGEAYARPVYGEVEEIEAVTGEEAVSAWRRMLEASPADAYVVGDVEPESARDTLTILLGGLRSGDRVMDLGPAERRRARRIRRFREHDEVVQSRLVMGYRTDVEPTSSASVAFSVWNTMFGGGSFSRLYREIREKRSLAYYCSSSADLAKGVLFVQAGIDGSAAPRVERVVRDQMRELRAGRFETEELRAAKACIRSGLNAVMDSPARIAGFLQERRALGSSLTVPELQARVRGVRRDAVVRAARSISSDTYYLLTGREGAAPLERGAER
jgi:predicted Zn-dependent peptidase